MSSTSVVCMLGLLASSVLAAPAPNSCVPTWSYASYDATFDDLAALPAVPEANFVPTPYDALKYQSFIVNQLGVAGQQVVGVIPASGSNVGATSTVEQATNGSPLITTKYTGSKVSTFSLNSFYYACAINSVASAAGSATECVIQLTGQDANGKTIAGPRNFQYTFTNALEAPMNFANVAGQFNDITTLLVDTIQSDATVDLTGTFIDSVRYTTKSALTTCS